MKEQQGQVDKRCNCPRKTSATTGKRLAVKHTAECQRTVGWFVKWRDAADPVAKVRKQNRKSGFATEEAAREFLDRVLSEQARGVGDGGVLVGAYMVDWLAGKIDNGMRPTTARSYRSFITRNIIPVIGEKRLRDVNPTDVRNVLRSVTAGPVSVRRCHGTLTSALNDAVRLELIGRNPAQFAELPRVPKKQATYWELAECGEFLDRLSDHCERADDFEVRAFGVACEVMAYSGVRRGECLGLRTVDLKPSAEQDRSALVIQQQVVQIDGLQPPCEICGRQHTGAVIGEPKSDAGKGRRVPIPSATVGLLGAFEIDRANQATVWGEAWTEHGLILPRASGDPARPSAFTARFAQMVKTFGLPKLTPHGLRHCYVAREIAAGTPIATISKRIGHANIGLTINLYGYLLDDGAQEQVERSAAMVPRGSVGSRVGSTELTR